MRRRDFVAGGSAALLLPACAPAIIGSARLRPQAPYGAMCGDPAGDKALVWSAADRPAQLVVEWSRDPAFRNPVRQTGSLARAETGFTARCDLAGLPPDAPIFYRTAFHDPDDARLIGEWTTGSLHTTGGQARPVRFTFAGDEAGQGFGINPDFGGYRLYEAMRRKRPDFFVHQGDQIYADAPLQPGVTLPDGQIWRNIVTPAKDHIAETLGDFRGAYAYNLLDAHKRAFLSEVPMLVQWDDHEVRNNWYPDKALGGAIPMPQLIAHARQALLEFNPIRPLPGTQGIYRSFRFGPHLEVFLLDARSARASNAQAASAGHPAVLFGERQLAWLETGLARSTATWKLIASDIPLSLTVPDLNRDVAPGGIEGLANGIAGAPGGREQELAQLLSFMQRSGLRNTVWISADVHYAAAIHYDPARAAFTEFTPFWEFVAGPINAGTGRIAGNPLDPTFGPQVIFKADGEGASNASPLAGNQFFGMGEIDPVTGSLTITLNDVNGRELYRQELLAVPQAY